MRSLTLCVTGAMATSWCAFVTIDRSDGAKFGVLRRDYSDRLEVVRHVDLPGRESGATVPATPAEEAACTALVSTLDTTGWDISASEYGSVHLTPPRKGVPHAAFTLRSTADAIERGEHRKERAK